MSRLATKRPDEILIEYFYSLKNWDYEDKEFLKENHIIFGRFLKPARDLLILCDNDLEKAKMFLEKVINQASANGLEEAGIEYAIEKYLEITNAQFLQKER